MLIDIITALKDYVATEEQSTILRYVNAAAKELYDSADLPGSLFERDFCVDATNQHVTVPWYAKEIRGVRRKEYFTQQQIVDMRPRYNKTPWMQPCNQWRLIAETPLEQHITQAGRLVVTLAEAEETAVDVIIVGQTTTSNIFTETLTFAPGDLTKTTSKQYTQPQPFGIKSIIKSRLTTYDVTVTQEADERQIATIPNVLRRASNQLVSLRDEEAGPFSDSECYEILFKWPYIELINDTDEFLNSDRYDQVIAWKAKANYSFLSPDDHPRMLIAEEKCNALLRRISDTYESNTDRRLEVERPFTGTMALTQPFNHPYGTY